MAEEKESKGMQMMEMKGIIRMLSATAERAEHLRMTGATDERSAMAVRQYNNVVERVNKYAASEGLFAPLEEDVSLVDLGMCCEQMAAYLKGMMEEAGVEKKGDAHGDRVIVNIGGDLKELGEVVRQAMPAWIREQMGREKPKEEDEEPEADMNDVESRIAELGAQMQVLAERMHREELSSDEIRKMADQMRELGQQQSELAKQHATVRAQIKENNGQ